MSKGPEQRGRQQQESSATENTTSYRKDSDNKFRKEENKKSSTGSLHSRSTTLRTKDEKDLQETNLKWWDVFKISVAGYVPAFLIVFLTSLVVLLPLSFKPAPTSLQEEDSSLTTQQKDQIGKEVKKQAKTAVREEIDILRADWKGDLFGQITLPVIFAIASIFAAFAVKEILIKILEEQEKNRIKQELKQDLEQELKERIVPDIFLIEKEEIYEYLQALEGYIFWLEHELLRIETEQVLNQIDEINISTKSKLKIDKRELLVIEKIFERLKVTLSMTSSAFTRKDLEQLRQAENKLLEAKVRSTGLDETEQNEILDKLNGGFYINSREDRSLIEIQREHMDEIFQAQKGLLIIKLSKLNSRRISSQLEADIKEIIEILSKDSRLELKIDEQKIIQDQQQSDVKPPTF